MEPALLPCDETLEDDPVTIESSPELLTDDILEEILIALVEVDPFPLSGHFLTVLYEGALETGVMACLPHTSSRKERVVQIFRATREIDPVAFEGLRDELRIALSFVVGNMKEREEAHFLSLFPGKSREQIDQILDD